VEELRSAKLFAGEQEQLEEERTRLENVSDILEKLQLAENLISSSDLSALFTLKEANQALLSIAKLSDTYKMLADRLNSCQVELKDVVREIERNQELTEADPERLMEVTSRLDTIYALLRKHHLPNDVALVELLAKLEDELSRTGFVDEKLENLKNALDGQYKELMDKGKAISSARKAVFPQIEKEIVQTLAQLGMADSVLQVRHELGDPTRNGLDKINFLFSANKGVAPQELKKAASGGEFSRLMFAVKYLVAGKTALPTIIFDEIDTGVSGEVALKLGRMLEKMGESLQVITITHLPQVASKGKAHYFVYKDHSASRTTSKVRLLNENERLHELAQMIGGENYSATATQSAKELLNGN
ncbi:MAG: DNA repair protein RecN, partial [Cytophagales bacterium]|nr:DNA repair protein RecN [Cytophagales bacterium]